MKWSTKSFLKLMYLLSISLPNKLSNKVFNQIWLSVIMINLSSRERSTGIQFNINICSVLS
jgi:hypothetical protein